MVKKQKHLKQAARNWEVSKLLGERKSNYPEWVVTTVFYEAVHHVEAAFACIEGVRHSETARREKEQVSHTRWRLIKAHFNQDVQRSYYELEMASKSTRYLLDNYSDFYDSSIVGMFIDDYLKVIKTESAKLIK